MKNPTDDKNRHIESYIKAEKPAPQPSPGRSVEAEIERESAKRRNGTNGNERIFPEGVGLAPGCVAERRRDNDQRGIDRVRQRDLPGSIGGYRCMQRPHRLRHANRGDS